tara:strand:- start:4799 stop:5542 length:744 start_codon:yes stop_codon:yes gene_type:complete
MKIIISPAKKLNDRKINLQNTSDIQFLNETKYLIKELQKYSLIEIKKMMNISDKLALLNYERFQNWDLDSSDVMPAILLFKGDVYKGLKADSFSNEQLNFAQDHLRIISGLYGLLRPLDLVFPYRLEMGTNIQTNKADNLYEFWNDKLRLNLISEMKDNEILINLASNEYSKALELNQFKQKVITPVFKDSKNGKLKVISFYAKRARGEMVNFIVQNKIKDISDVKSFDYGGYTFVSEESNEILFAR